MKFFKPFTPPVAPIFPDKDFNIIDFGAKQGKENTIKEPLARAIAECSAKGGGRVVIPEGNWFTGGPIHLKSNVNLHIAEGAVVEFSTDFNDYLPVVFGLVQGIRAYTASHFIYAFECENIAVTGKGILNGHGEAWWPESYSQPGLIDMREKGRNLVPVNQRVYDKREDGVRPRFLQFVSCKNILIEDVTIINSPAWNVHNVYCENITVRNLIIENDIYSMNTDGVNLESCKRGLVENCEITSGDDMCCIKAGRDNDAWEVGIPCEDIEIRNCYGKHCRCGGITIGSETSASIRNIWIHDCKIDKANTVINFKTIKGRGGVIENIDFDNIHAGETTKSGVRITMKYDHSAGEELVGKEENFPEVRNISVSNITCKECPEALAIIGVKGHEMENIYLENIEIYETGDSIIENVKNLCFENVTISKI